MVGTPVVSIAIDNDRPGCLPADGVGGQLDFWELPRYFDVRFPIYHRFVAIAEQNLRIATAHFTIQLALKMEEVGTL